VAFTNKNHFKKALFLLVLNYIYDI